MPRSSLSTTENIIETAEQLFGLHGINGVSLRQIGLEAGSANNYSVQYHFGNRDGLVRAIFAYRLPGIEARRQKLMQALSRSGRTLSVPDLVAVMFVPLAEQVDRRGRHSYATFLAGLARFDQLLTRNKLASLAPIADRATAMLAERLPHLSAQQLERRIVAVTSMVLSVIVLQRSTVNRSQLDDVLQMAAVALQTDTRPAPSKPRTRKARPAVAKTRKKAKPTA